MRRALPRRIELVRVAVERGRVAKFGDQFELALPPPR
jgi:hypothetical protein